MVRFVFFLLFKRERERSSRGPNMFLLLTVKKMLRFCARSFQQLQTTFTSRTSSSAKRKCGSREVHDVIKNNQAVLHSPSYVRIFLLWAKHQQKKEPVRDALLHYDRWVNINKSKHSSFFLLRTDNKKRVRKMETEREWIFLKIIHSKKR